MSLERGLKRGLRGRFLLVCLFLLVSAGLADWVGRVGKESDIGSVVLYLCSRAGTYVNGQILNVDGGWLVSPWPYIVC